LAQGRISERPRRGLATEEVRRHNLAAVLGRLHLGGPMSRSELANQTGLNRSTIRDLIAQLTELGLVVESKGTPTSGPGRPSSIASVSPAGAVVLAIELEVDSLAVATVGLGGHLFGERREANPPDDIAPEEVISRLVALAAPLLGDLPRGHRLVGAGVAVAGIVRRSDGFVHMAPNLGWHNVAIGEMIRERMGIDLVRVANEADLGALGEFRRGSAGRSNHIIFVAGEVGVGIGVIHEATPMLGSSGYAGEAGHAVVNPDGRACRCGSRGCWETEVGEDALIRRVGMKDWSDGSPLEEILRRAQQGDIRTLSGLDEVGRWLGTGIGNLINIFNPDLVVVGGFFHALYPFMSGAVEAGAKEVTLEAPWDTCEIRRSELGTRAMLIGAAELVLGEVVADSSALVDSSTKA
jgi:predicted NBD/HSP70 family sugar kinase